MPRIIDYSCEDLIDQSEPHLAEPRFGHNEILPKDVEQYEINNSISCGFFWPQFSKGLTHPTSAFGEQMDAAHLFLSQNTTGPWFMTESWGNCGHALTTYVYVARLNDAKAFQQNFDFNHAPDWRKDTILPLAQLQGVVRPYDEKESFEVWRRKNQGFTLSFPLEAKDRNELIRISFSLPALEKQFVKDWGDVLSVDASVSPPLYTIPQIVGGRASPKNIASWCEKNGISDEHPNILRTRYPEVAAALMRDWGQHITPTDNPLVFTQSRHPVPTREIPEDFMRYLRGEQETYEAPYRQKPGAPTLG